MMYLNIWVLLKKMLKKSMFNWQLDAAERTVKLVRQPKIRTNLKYDMLHHYTVNKKQIKPLHEQQTTLVQTRIKLTVL